ncbi:MAG TPA: DUF4124 domain-containing protein [Burkholderiales bacterium]|nr:DUF4124 domain-containing protein [Burkholderiales bacterium]
MRSAIHCALALALCSAGALAQQPIFKSTMPDGRVIYGEKPEAGAKRVDKVEAPPPKSGVTGLTPEERARAEQLTRQRAAENAASATKQRELDEARKQLKAAEAAREAGKEPLPGERLGLAGGGTRLSDAYHQRQKSLEAAVETARKRLQAAEGR